MSDTITTIAESLDDTLRGLCDANVISWYAVHQSKSVASYVVGYPTGATSASSYEVTRRRPVLQGRDLLSRAVSTTCKYRVYTAAR